MKKGDGHDGGPNGTMHPVAGKCKKKHVEEGLGLWARMNVWKRWCSRALGTSRLSSRVSRWTKQR